MAKIRFWNYLWIESVTYVHYLLLPMITGNRRKAALSPSRQETAVSGEFAQVAPTSKIWEGALSTRTKMWGERHHRKAGLLTQCYFKVQRTVYCFKWFWPSNISSKTWSLCSGFWVNQLFSWYLIWSYLFSHMSTLFPETFLVEEKFHKGRNFLKSLLFPAMSPRT